MKKKILVVDDEKDIVEVLRYNLSKEGYDVITVYNGKDALQKISENIDLVILDVMMPELDGLEVCKKIKADPKTSKIPVMFLTAKDSEIDEVLGLEIGADDYIAKPISMKKLLARIKNILRRQIPQEVSVSDVIEVEDLAIDTENYLVKVKNREILFTKKEFEILIYLVRNRGRIISREKLLDKIWGEDILVGQRTIDVHIRKIREKLGVYCDYVETIKGIGYRFKK